MKFLCDVHIPRKLVRYLQAAGFEAIHVNDILEGSQTQDGEISSFADRNGLIVITKDSDFRDSYLLRRKPMKLVRILLGNISNEALISAFGQILPSIVEWDRNRFFYLEIHAEGWSVIEVSE